MSLQAVIMAGGAGTRLRPLTCDLPKPLAPLCGAPVMDYALALLARHGIREATATLCYRPEAIERAFGAGRRGVALTYRREDEPLGTAGSVARAVREGANPVLVLSGDGLNAVDLSEALRFHRERGAAATLVLHHVDVPLAYGVVVTDAQGRVARFIEKPDWSRVVSSLVNTGVYLLAPEALRLIPRDRPFDFGRELFPLLLEKGLPVYGYVSAAYWCDVGTPQAFLDAQGDLLLGRAGFAPADRGMREIAGVTLSEDSYVSAQARVEAGAVLARACVLPEAVIGACACLEGAIVCPRARVGRDAALREGCVVGASASVGDGARLESGACVWPGVAAPAQAVLTHSVRRSPDFSLRQSADALPPERAALLAGALLHAQRASTVAVMHDGRQTALYHSLLGALSAYGAARVWALGRGSAGMLSHAVRSLPAELGVCAREEGLLLLGRDGLPLNEAETAAVEGAALRQETPALCGGAGAIRAHASLRGDYLRALARDFSGSRGAEAALVCKDRFLRALARDALRLCGHRLSAEGGATLSLSQNDAQLLLPDGAPDDARQFLLCARALRQLGFAVYDTEELNAPDCLAADKSDACLRQRLILQDGVARALLLLSLFAHESPREALRALPALAREQADIPCEARDKGRVLEALLRDAAPRPQGGLAASRNGAHAVIRPDPALPLMHVSVTAGDTEQARELCAFFEEEIRRALPRRQ